MIQFTPEPGVPHPFDAFVRRLLEADWESTTGPMRFSASLTLSDLADAAFLHNTRVLMAGLAAEQGTPATATATGNLTRAFVGKLFDRLTLSAHSRESIRAVCKVVNELDVWPLHLARVVAECAGLLARRNKRFQLTKAGRELLLDEQAGALYRRLFLAYFRRFNLQYDFHLRDAPFIQQSFAAILWRLDTVARDWTPVRGLARHILLRAVFEQLHAAMKSPYDKEEWILDGYVLRPLFDLGLIERKPPSEWPSVTENDQIRTSALWRKFITFEPWSGGPS
jgi:hypothetical protein